MRAPSNFHGHRISHGFTLVEVLVAMTIMSTIALMSWQGVDGIVRTQRATKAKLDRILLLNTALAQWDHDLSALQQPGGGMPVERISFNGSAVTMTRETQGGLQVVVWALRRGVVQRWAGPPVTTDRALQEQLSNSARFLGNEAGQLDMVTGISEWQLLYYAGEAWTNAQNTQSGQILATKLSLTMSGTTGDVGQVVRETLLRP